MQLTIVLEDRKTKEVFGLAENIHHVLRGNLDYVDSNVVLSFGGARPQMVSVIFRKDGCRDPELIRVKVKEIVDIFMGPAKEERS